MKRFKPAQVIVMGGLVLAVLAAAGLALRADSIAALLSPGGFLPVIVSQPPADPPLPDLKINYVSITYEDPTCWHGDESMGLRVWISNRGLASAGPFVVQIEGQGVNVDSLGAGEQISVWISGYSMQPLVIVDVLDQVAESDETNNVFNEPVPIPTRPVPCAALTAIP